MPEDTANELIKIVDTTAQKLKTLDEVLVREKPAPNKWSIQQVLGHLVDSAVNNHHRFVRAQEVDVFIFPKYEQDSWVSVQDYNASSWVELIELWRLYNRHLVQVIKRVPHEKLEVECRIGPYEPVTLGYLIEDYLVHLKHHLRQIEDRIAALPDHSTN